MSCLDENDVLEFLDRRMPTDRATRVEAHLADCRACRALVACAAEEKPQIATTSLAGAAIGAEPRVNLAQQLAHAQAMQRIGTTLRGKWTIDRFIGAGGMAHVFSGTHRNGRQVAIKMLKPQLAMEPELVRRFLREGYVANRVEHPGAVAVLDDDIADDGTPFLVMEFLAGETLKGRLARTGPLPLAEALRLADECLAVLGAAHARGVVHRDIKPENLFITKDGKLKVLDFGIARLRESTQPGEAQTHAGQMIGTPGYMAPEQARGRTEAIDARTDVWALGATIFAMLAGHALQRAGTVPELLALAMTTPAEPTSRASSRVPSAIGQVLDRALAFEASRRFADAAEFRSALRAAAAQAVIDASVDGSVVGTAASLPPPRAKSLWLVALLGGLLVVAFGLIAGRTLRTSEPSAREAAGAALPPATAAPESLNPSAITSTAPSIASAVPTPAPSATTSAAPAARASVKAAHPAPPRPPAEAPAAAATAEPSERDPLGPRR